MDRLIFIPENRFKELVESEAERTREEGKDFIKTQEGFRNHLINVGNIGYDTSKKILANHPTLKSILSPGVVRTADYTHDIGKFEVGDAYHDIQGAYDILTKGEKEWELVAGGSKSDRKQALIRIARCLPSDFAVGEELGGDDFPDSVLYPYFVTDRILEQVEFLRYELSPTKTPLSIVELTSPCTLEQQIAIYADMVDITGNVKERLDELVVRYKGYARDEQAKQGVDLDLKEAKVNYYKTMARLGKQITPRILAVTGLVKELVRSNK